MSTSQNPKLSSSQNPIDLNLSLSGQPTATTPTSQPLFAPFPIPQMPPNSVLINPVTALRSADQISTPRDHDILARRSDYAAADESTWLSMQASASVTNVCHRLRSRVRENESLNQQLISVKKLLQNSSAKVKRLKNQKQNYKEENKELKKENRGLKEELRNASLMLTKYQTEMKEPLNALKVSGERLEAGQRVLINDVPSTSNPKP